MLLLTVLFAAKAQYFPIDTARLNSAYRAIISGERNIKTEMEFLETYPTTWLEFYMTYNYVDDKEYDIEMSQLCTEHISTLFGLSRINDIVFDVLEMLDTCFLDADFMYCNTEGRH